MLTLCWRVTLCFLQYLSRHLPLPTATRFCRLPQAVSLRRQNSAPMRPSCNGRGQCCELSSRTNIHVQPWNRQMRSCGRVHLVCTLNLLAPKSGTRLQILLKGKATFTLAHSAATNLGGETRYAASMCPRPYTWSVMSCHVMSCPIVSYDIMT